MKGAADFNRRSYAFGRWSAIVTANPYESPSDPQVDDTKPTRPPAGWLETTYAFSFPSVLAVVAFSCAGMMIRFGPHMAGSRTEVSSTIALLLALALSLAGIVAGVRLRKRDAKAIAGYVFHAFMILFSALAIPLLIVSWLLIR